MSFDLTLQRMFERRGVDTLPAHLEETCGIPVAKMTQLDVGVFRIDRADGGHPVVARLFSSVRPSQDAQGDLAVLSYLAEVDFPAERPATHGPLTTHENQSLLLTEFVREVPKAKRPAYPIVKLGTMIARLHGLAVPAGADRPAGALHHFAEGTMTDELRSAAGWLDSVESRVPDERTAALDLLRGALADADGGDGLPEAFVHPDPVPKNVIFTADGPVLVDWTSSGRGPRLASMTLVLNSGWAAQPFMKGYSKLISLTDDEGDRLPGLLFSRHLINMTFRFCRDPATASPTPKKLDTLRRACDSKAHELLA